jgi:hypothetical protein
VVDPLPRILFLLRFLCFMAVVYLALHAIVIRLISKSDSKLIWFFSVVTDPLTRPVRSWLRHDAPPSHVLFIALIVYGLLWICLIAAGRFVSDY